MLRTQRILICSCNFMNKLAYDWQKKKISTTAISSKSILFSGIQPTGVPHLGNYIGAVKNWVNLQKDTDLHCIFSIVDLHSLTNPAEPIKRKQNIYESVVTLLACGIDPDKAILFQQSDVKEHAELNWILTCMTTEARLKQVPQWKEKAKMLKMYSFGLIAYPVLMAADIMLYRASKVPVGEDQLQHLQLCRDLAVSFNKSFDIEYFPVCEWLLTDAPRIRSLRKPQQKMSKSDPAEKSRINLDDTDDGIRAKIKAAVTDNTSRVYYSEERPGVSNLIDIHSALSGLSYKEIETTTSSMDTGQYKTYLADVVCDYLRPIRKRYHDILKNPDYVRAVLNKGRDQATEIASRNMNEIKDIIGLKWL